MPIPSGPFWTSPWALPVKPSRPGPGLLLSTPLNPHSYLCSIRHDPLHCASFSGSSKGYVPKKSLSHSLPLSKKSASSTTCTVLLLPGQQKRYLPPRQL